MKIAIVHYHLQTGGVTNVIHSANEALRGSDAEILIIAGEGPEEGIQIDNLAIIEGLNYRRTAFLSVAEGLTDAIKDAAEAHFGTQPDVWHFHNHSLGKNVLMPLVISDLAEEKARILLQIHDFPEDGRPQNYVAQRRFFDLEKEFSRTFYPVAPQIHYATINHRDHGFLRKAGMKSEQVHQIPNSVPDLKTTATPQDRPFSKDKKFILYPTRAIRRKNIGELLLLALAYGDEYDFATSQVPHNPEWKPFHDLWRDLSHEMDLPIRFGIGQSSEYSFPDLVGWSDAMITTSVAEGFGLAFLEPWLSGKSIVGRNLPRITCDFGDTGINLDHLYERIDIPLDWVDEDALRKTADDTLRRTYLAYNRPLPKNAVNQTFSRWIANGCVDFGMLNEEFQRSIIQKAASDPGALKGLNIPSLTPSSDTANQKRLVQEHYSLDTYRETLLSIYSQVANSPHGKVKSLNPIKVLDQFLDPWRLNLLRV